MKHRIQHELAPEPLRLALRNFAQAYCKRFAEYQTTAVWLNEDQLEVRFKVKGMGLRGTLTLLPREIAIEMDVPLPFRLFKGRAVRAIEEEVRPWLDQAALKPP